MPNTSTFSLPYPLTSDAPNVPSHIQSLATAVDTAMGKNAQLLAFGQTGTNVTDTTTNYISAGSVTATVPSGLLSTRRVLVLASSQFQVTTVGNVNLAISMTDAITAGQSPASFTPYGGSVATRAPNPTAGVGYHFFTWALNTPPTAGSHTWTLRAANISTTGAGWTSFYAQLAVILI